MKMMLAENIRAFRKERSLTQEQLSEALGVTAGAVYKWEAKLSIPELELIATPVETNSIKEPETNAGTGDRLHPVKLTSFVLRPLDAAH